MDNFEMQENYGPPQLLSYSNSRKRDKSSLGAPLILDDASIFARRDVNEDSKSTFYFWGGGGN